MSIQNQTITIIGAGPAGQIASLFLAKRGIPSLLIDKSAHPRLKPCADVVTGQAIRILHELDASLPLKKYLRTNINPFRVLYCICPMVKHWILIFYRSIN